MATYKLTNEAKNDLIRIHDKINAEFKSLVQQRSGLGFVGTGFDTLFCYIHRQDLHGKLSWG